MEASAKEDRERALISLGIALHSYADTWAHQGFSGRRKSRDNDIRSLRIRSDAGIWEGADLATKFISYAAPDIGHAEAGTLPDRSNVAWDCKPPKTESKRDNTAEFLAASKEILSLLSSATGCGKPWNDLRSNLEHCLQNPTREVNSPKEAWRKTFPRIGFVYDDREWFDAALERDGGLLDLIGDALNVDPLDYKVRYGQR